MRAKGNGDIVAVFVLLLGLGFVQFVRGLPLVQLAMNVGLPAALQTVRWNAATCMFGRRSGWDAEQQAKVAAQIQKVQCRTQRIETQQLQKRLLRAAQEQQRYALRNAAERLREQAFASMEQVRRQQFQQLEMLRTIPHDFAAQR